MGFVVHIVVVVVVGFSWWVAFPVACVRHEEAETTALHTDNLQKHGTEELSRTSEPAHRPSPSPSRLDPNANPRLVAS